MGTKWPEFDIYFERAFRIMKDQMEGYESQVFEKLSSGGVVISDSGFKEVGLEKIDLPISLSAYQEMMAGLKK